MWMRLCISLHGQDKVQDRWQPTCFVEEPLDDYQKIIVLRDPVERWISNCPAPGTIDCLSQDQNAIRDLFDRIHQWQYDEHSAPQFDFINGLDFSNVTWFRCDSNLSENIQGFFQKQKFKHYRVPAAVNQQNQDKLTTKSADIWRQLLQEPEHLRKFKIAFQKDYDLIDSVSFYCHEQ